jgi:hypothetical protein
MKYINAAFRVDVQVGGTAAFNFLVTSRGFSTRGIFPSPAACKLSLGADDSSACAEPAVLAASPPIVLNVGYISATISAKLVAAAAWTGALTGSLQVGAGATLGTPCAPVKLGGRLQVSDMQALISDCSAGTADCLAAMRVPPNELQAYTSFPFAYSRTPLNVKLD